jgi:hypothetical protein
VYSKNKLIEVLDDDVVFKSSYHSPFYFKYDEPFLLKKEKDSFKLKVDSVTEFPFATRANLIDIAYTEGQVIIAKGIITSATSSLRNLQLCISITSEKGDSTYYFSSNKISDFVQNVDSTYNMYVSAFMGTDFIKIKDKAKITVFFWNSGKEKFEINNLEIKTIDYWRKKWNFWN